jgi:hypothetical protein
VVKPLKPAKLVRKKTPAEAIFYSGLPGEERREQLLELEQTAEVRSYLRSLAFGETTHQNYVEPKMRIKGKHKDDEIYLFERDGTEDAYLGLVEDAKLLGPVPKEELSDLAVWEPTEEDTDVILSKCRGEEA